MAAILSETFTDKGTWRNGPKRWGRSPDAAAENREFWDVLALCLKLLSPQAMFAFCQRELEDTSSEEICEVLDVTPTNFWTLLHRARTRLRRCLESNWFRREA
jgi:RNA polymerase sigma-70 factor (ECF subfamily)